MESKDIFIFGDSLVFGMFDEDKGGWVNRLRLKLEELDPNKQSCIFNLGIPGNTTTDLVKRFDIECSIRAPKADNLIIIFGIGANDVKKMHIGESTEEIFKENINTLINDAKKYTNKIAFIGFIKADENIREEYKHEKMIKLDNTIKEICEKEGITYIYMYDAVEIKDLTDGLHANSTGHQKMFERVFEIVKDM